MRFRTSGSQSPRASRSSSRFWPQCGRRRLPPRGSRSRAATPGPVRASMQIRHIDPWSALKVSALLNVALFFVWMIAVAFLYLVLGAMGVWASSTATSAICSPAAAASGKRSGVGRVDLRRRR